jgi:UDP:flavonoid glycosyltransferase YjiC (YdhE family)
VSAHFARPLNRLRRRHGLSPLGGLRQVNTWGDYTLYADTPGLVPTRALPPHHRYLGPVLWSPDLPLPEWWTRVPQDRPAIYVTLGSSGPAERLPELVGALARLPVEVLVATAGWGGELPALPNVWSAPFLPGQKAAARSALVVCNGGSATAYQALAEGVPVLGICSNMDQFMTMRCIEKAGAGLWLRAGQARAQDVAAAAGRLMNQMQYGESARRIAEEFRRYAAGSLFSELMKEVTE